MKWKWDNAQQKRTKYRAKMGAWHRKFCFWPRRDYESQTTYWLQYVWQRVTRWSNDDLGNPNSAVPYHWEYRDGNRHAPFIKQCPPHLTPSVVQPSTDLDTLYVPDAARDDYPR